MSLASTFNDTQRWTRMIQWGNQFFSRCFDVFQSPVPCNQQYAMSYCEGEGFWLIFPSWNSEHWPLCGESLGLVSRFSPFLSLVSSQCRSGPHEDLNTVTSSITVRLSTHFKYKCTRPPAGWDARLTFAARITSNTISRCEEIRWVTTDKARWGQAQPDTNTWHHCEDWSKCVIPTKATPVTMQPDFPINFIIPLSHQIDQYNAKSSLLDNWPKVRRKETTSGYLQLRTFWDGMEIFGFYLQCLLWARKTQFTLFNGSKYLKH